MDGGAGVDCETESGKPQPGIVSECWLSEEVAVDETVLGVKSQCGNRYHP